MGVENLNAEESAAGLATRPGPGVGALLIRSARFIPSHPAAIVGLTGLLMPMEVFYTAGGLNAGGAGGEPPLAIGGVFITYLGAALLIPALMGHVVERAKRLLYPAAPGQAPASFRFFPSFFLFSLGLGVLLAFWAVASWLRIPVPQGMFGGVNNPAIPFGPTSMGFALLTAYPLGVLWWLSVAALVAEGKGIFVAIGTAARVIARHPAQSALFVLVDVVLLTITNMALAAPQWVGAGPILWATIRGLVTSTLFVFWGQAFTAFLLSFPESRSDPS